jgi:hypothetical protein
MSERVYCDACKAETLTVVDSSLVAICAVCWGGRAGTSKIAGRPTCATCPYWSPDGESGGGYCHRRAPQSYPQSILKMDDDGQSRHWGSFSQSSMLPEAFSGDWCGEHPDFPEYIAGLKK